MASSCSRVASRPFSRGAPFFIPVVDAGKEKEVPHEAEEAGAAFSFALPANKFRTENARLETVHRSEGEDGRERNKGEERLGGSTSCIPRIACVQEANGAGKHDADVHDKEEEKKKKRGENRKCE